MKVFLHKEAEKYLKRLNETDQKRIKDAIKKLEKEPPEGNIESMAGQNGFRTRIGDYRILWRVAVLPAKLPAEESYLLVTHIDPRGQVYKKKNKGNKR